MAKKILQRNCFALNLLYLCTKFSAAPFMKSYLSLIKFSHTIFALPFAMLGYFIAVEEPQNDFSWQVLGLVILCMVFARSASMAFNRYLDRDIDAKNDRTRNREIPAGVLSANSVLLFVVLNSLAFIACTYFINSLCFYLSPVALLITLGYSYTKRFTALCHVVLGLGLALAPVGAYLAVGGQFGVVPVVYGFAVLFWVAGFDIIYALQDEDLDRSLNLYSTPVWLGKKKALNLSKVFHVLTALLILYAAYLITFQFIDLGFLHLIGASLFIALLIYQHTLVSPHDLSKVNLAFFTTNGLASLIFGTFVIFDLLT